LPPKSNTIPSSFLYCIVAVGEPNVTPVVYQAVDAVTTAPEDARDKLRGADRRITQAGRRRAYSEVGCAQPFEANIKTRPIAAGTQDSRDVLRISTEVGGFLIGQRKSGPPCLAKLRSPRRAYKPNTRVYEC